ISRVPFDPFTAPIVLDESLCVCGAYGKLHFCLVDGTPQWEMDLQGRMIDLRKLHDGNLILFLEIGGIVLIEGTAL
ncbi:MAG: hypothetical protein KDC38_02345, partial [Planctomycetes bacterium]|nr:hypothetical protein [Planctomycetota bacterium]